MNKRHNTSGIYRTIREICGRKWLQQACIKDKDGVVVPDVTEVLARIKEYTENLYKTNKRQLRGRQLLGNVEDDPEPLIEQVREAMKKLKSGKSPGYDEILAELWKASGEAGVRLMHDIERYGRTNSGHMSGQK